MHFISKCFVLDVKSYHTYLFVDMYLDQTFVNDVLRKMLEHRDFERNNTLVIESDNCFPQCKYAGHSFILSQIASTHDIIHTNIFGVAVLNNYEVGQVGSLFKFTSRKDVAAEQKFSNAAIMDCLQYKFGDDESLLYYFK